jgi:preprotein translocase subunit SecE
MVNKSLIMQNYIRWFLGISIIGIAVYGNSYFAQEALLYRVLGVIVISAIGLFVLSTTIEGKESLKIILESRTEIRRVVWPTRTETTQTVLIVVVAIIVCALLLWGLDSLFGWATAKLLG